MSESSAASNVSGFSLSGMKFGAKTKIKVEEKKEKEITNFMYENMCYEATKRV